MEIKVTNNQKKIKIGQRKTKLFIKKALKSLAVDPGAAVKFSFVGKEDIKRLNRKYFKKDRLTDVIALGYHGRGCCGLANPHCGYIGDVIICPEVAARNASYYDQDLSYELALYVVHGLLHLLGYEDTYPKKARLMRKKEKEILNLVWKK
jgi:probable rRNA maturation factor